MGKSTTDMNASERKQHNRRRQLKYAYDKKYNFDCLRAKMDERNKTKNKLWKTNPKQHKRQMEAKYAGAKVLRARRKAAKAQMRMESSVSEIEEDDAIEHVPMVLADVLQSMRQEQKKTARIQSSLISFLVKKDIIGSKGQQPLPQMIPLP